MKRNLHFYLLLNEKLELWQVQAQVLTGQLDRAEQSFPTPCPTPAPHRAWAVSLSSSASQALVCCAFLCSPAVPSEAMEGASPGEHAPFPLGASAREGRVGSMDRLKGPLRIEQWKWVRYPFIDLSLVFSSPFPHPPLYFGTGGGGKRNYTL